MIIPKKIVATLAAGAGGGITDNGRVTATRTNCTRIEFNSPGGTTGNTGLFRIAHSDYTDGNSGDGTFANPTNPLTNSSAFKVLQPGESYEFVATGEELKQGHKYDLSLFWYQGDNAGEKLEVVYHIIRAL